MSGTWEGTWGCTWEEAGTAAGSAGRTSRLVGVQELQENHTHVRHQTLWPPETFWLPEFYL